LEAPNFQNFSYFYFLKQVIFRIWQYISSLFQIIKFTHFVYLIIQILYSYLTVACSCRMLPIMDLQTSLSSASCCCVTVVAHYLSHLWLYVNWLGMRVFAFQEYVFQEYIHWLTLSLNFQVFLYVQKNFIWLFLIIFKSSLFIPVISKTVLFEILSVHDILYNLLKTHISIASSLLSKSLFKIHVLQPYNKTEYTNVFTMFIFVDLNIFI